MISENEIQKLIKQPGRVRGVVFETDKKYILRKWGEEGIKKIEDLSVGLGFPIKYDKIKAMEWYPAALRVSSLLLIKETFDLKEEEIREIGRLAPEFSIIVRLFFKLFGSVEKLAKEIPSFWKALDSRRLEGDFS